VTAGGPYVGLDYFGEEDAGLFFGRDAERKRIIGNLRASPLTLLYAESGVGKSSLLRAGVASRLRQMPPRPRVGGSVRYMPVVFSTWRGDSRADLIAALEAAAQPLMRGDRELALSRGALEDAIKEVVKAAHAIPLVILDQFEERVLYEPDDEFDDELARCINRRDLGANFLISVREDAYSLIGSRFKARIANVYGNYLHLDFLDEQAARDAIVEPVKAFNRLRAGAPRIEVETALVDCVLEQVRRGRVKIGDGAAPDAGSTGPVRVETAYLQLVMKRLWDEEIAGGSQRLRLETLHRLGGADTIVHGHLDEVMAKLPDDQRDAAAAAFRFLVTAGGRKIALSSAELREFSDAPAAPLEPALAHLERERILRPIPSPEPGGVSRHEIYHDVLAPAILDWRRRHIQERTERGLARARERTRRLEVRTRRLSVAVVALTAIALALTLYVWDPVPMQKLELGTVDARFAVRGARPPDPRLVLITVDDGTLARFHAADDPRKLRRDAYASMLNRLRADRPAVIAVDVTFRNPSEPRGDKALRQAIRATHDRLVLPFDDFTIVTNASGKPTVQPKLFAGPRALSGVQTGFSGLALDRDDHNRRIDYAVETSAGIRTQTFPYAAANVARGRALQSNRLPTAPKRAWGGQSERTTWIDFRGPPGTIRRVPALRVLNGRVPAGAFAGKVVVVGVIRPGQDVHRTPLDKGHGMSGPEVQANAVDTILRGAPLRDASWVIGILAILVLACVPAVATESRFRYAVTAVVVVLAAGLFLLAAQLAFNAGWIIPVLVPLAALAASTIGVMALLITRTLRHHGAAESSNGPPEDLAPP
jgi:CHASE2 domain-containing sensor protein